MDELLKQVIAGAPNLIVAIAALYWLSRKLDAILSVLLTLLVDLIKKDAQNDSDTETTSE